MSNRDFWQDPNERYDYTVDWSSVLLGDEAIVSSQWSLTPRVSKGGSLAIVGAPTVLGQNAIAFVGGASQVGEVYMLENRITTDSTPTARIYVWSMTITITKK